MFRQERNFVAPVKVGDELDVSIEAVGEKGDGIAKKNGFVIFVPNTKQGDQVKIKVTKVLRKVGFGEVVGASSSPKEESSYGGESGAEQEQAEDTENFGEDAESNEE